MVRLEEVPDEEILRQQRASDAAAAATAAEDDDWEEEDEYDAEVSFFFAVFRCPLSIPTCCIHR